MGKMKNIGLIAGLIIVSAIVGTILVMLFPLPLPKEVDNRVGTIASDGTFTAINNGACDVIADTDYNGQHIVGFARVYVGNVPAPPPPPKPGNGSHITILPNIIHLNLKDIKKFTATVYDANGTIITDAEISWSIRNLPQGPGQAPTTQTENRLPKDATFYYNLKSILSIINITLLFALLYVYFKIYSTVKSKFTVGLIIMVFAMFVYAFTSNPLLQVLFGFRAEGLGPFAMVPDMFATIALVVLLYLSLE